MDLDQNKVNEMYHNKDLTKVLKIEIKRIKNGDEFMQAFVINDISKFF